MGSYKRKKITEAEAMKTLRLSPSSINTFRKCPRSWFYQYVLALETPTSIHLVRGNIVHQVLEDMFKARFVPAGEAFRPHMMTKSKAMLDKLWQAGIPALELSDEDSKMYYDETLLMVERFFKKFCDNVQSGIKAKKFQNETQGYYYTRPTFKELWVDDQFQINFTAKWKKDKTQERTPLENPMNVGGFIDSVQKDFDGNIILVDYKTSTKYQNVLSDDYTLQLAIYGYLWQKQTGRLPAFVAINYLKYDETFYILVTPSLIKEAVEKIKAMRNFITENGIDEKQYHAKFSKLCEWCPFQDRCAEAELQLKKDAEKISETKNE